VKKLSQLPAKLMRCGTWCAPQTPNHRLYLYVSTPLATPFHRNFPLFTIRLHPDTFHLPTFHKQRTRRPKCSSTWWISYAIEL